MKIRCIIIALLACCIFTTAEAKKKRSYSSNNDVIGISGDIYKLLNTQDIERDGTLVYPKYQYNRIDLGFIRPIEGKKSFDVEKTLVLLNNNRIGKRVLDFLLMRKGNKLSEELLQKRAMILINRTKSEEAEQGVLSKEDNLRDNIMPILKENYIFFQEEKRWIVFHVDIDEEIWKQVVNTWNDPERYETIEVPISFVAQGKGKPNFSSSGEISQIVYESVGISRCNKLLRKVSHKVPAFAIRGQVIGRSPFKAELPISSGIKKYDRIRVYRQSMNKNNELKARKICTARVTDIGPNDARLFTISGGHASYKKGDVAVLSKDMRISHSFTANYMDHSYGINYTFDWQLNLSKLGLSNHLLFSVGGGIFKDHRKNLYVVKDYTSIKQFYPDLDIVDKILYHSPYILDGAIGYGLGWTFAHRFQIMPYVMAQYEGLISQPKNHSDGSTLRIDSARVPVGMKAHINIWYPVQLVLGAEYDFVVWKYNHKGNDGNSETLQSYKTLERSFFDINGWKRTGLNLYAGFRFCL